MALIDIVYITLENGYSNFRISVAVIDPFRFFVQRERYHSTTSQHVAHTFSVSSLHYLERQH